ncbi:M20/M25/M40 family metallo-hydrolase [Bacillus timonensis]|uniref:M20/M25/M40 family metallo-hydrolase n=1 Tax=Bacillus timonensis TaxID=1033734 RepID=A0A4S3PPG9_9BACI|nr:M20/M25/M40 family metallo-hydrolase [Bacillus timonensis]THE11086.1 M20/M25/M40 family metallo-hydrolase [Bacillus timonensis]
MMKTLSMQTPEQMLKILNDLISLGSITLSGAEKQFPLRVIEYLKKVPYFVEHPDYVVNHPTTDGRSFLTALYKHEKAVKTVVMISHFDVVNIEDYGELKHLAFNPIELTKALFDHKDSLSEDVREDLETNEWVFGRGTMDMKCGLVQHMSLLEKAAYEEWEINLLLLTVCDEEVNSVGMREAIPKLLEISEQHELNYTLVLNSEPMFSLEPLDKNYYFYTGTIGKIMPAALCFGKESHVGESLSGINAGWMTATLSQEIEWNENLCETVNGQSCPPPTLLMQRDLKKEYSTQIPHRSVSLYNVFLMKKNAADVMDAMKDIAETAAHKMEQFMMDKYRHFNLNPNQVSKIRVLSYEQLKDFAKRKMGSSFVSNLEEMIAKQKKGDIREQCIQIVDEMAMYCQELAPMIVLFYAPPYYPAINTGNDVVIKELSEDIIGYTKENFGYELKPVEYFNGICDLSYAGLQGSLSDMNKYDGNLPGGELIYSIPFNEMSQLKAPVLNVGPIGRDAHKKTERLYLPFAFKQLPKLLEHLLQTHMKQ